MATDKQLIDRKNSRLDVVPEVLNDGISGEQKKIWQKFAPRLGQISRDSAGFIEITTENLNLVQEIITGLQNIVQTESQYLALITQFAIEFNSQIDINDDYFLQAFDQSGTNVSRQVVTNQRRTAVNTLTDISPTLLEPVKQSLDGAISSGIEWTDMVKQIEAMVIGDDQVDGRLLRHSKQIASDSFALADRGYTNSISEELGLEWYLYSGGLIESTKNARGTVTSKGTREFCKVRNGKYYHKKEIQEWSRGGGEPKPSGTWQGQMPNTDERSIFQRAGGFNCKHSIMPVSLSVVPKSVIDRNISNGNFEPTQFERDFLNI